MYMARWQTDKSSEVVLGPNALIQPRQTTVLHLLLG